MNPSQNPSAIRSKKEITDTLLQLMKTYPYKEITVKHIILESQIARKTFYRNFNSKDDVLNSYIDCVMNQYVQSLQDIPSCQLSNILNTIFSFCLQNRDLLFQLRDNELCHLLLKKWNVFIPMIHSQVVSENHPMFKSITPEQIDYVLAFNVGAVWNVIMEWIEQDMEDSPETIKATLLKYLNNLSLFI